MHLPSRKSIVIMSNCAIILSCVISVSSYWPLLVYLLESPLYCYNVKLCYNFILGDLSGLLLPLIDLSSERSFVRYYDICARMLSSVVFGLF